MSNPKEAKVLSHGEVQKKILEKTVKARPKEELLGFGDRYRDENFEIYNSKKKKFLETCKIYKKLNEETLICNRKRLLEDYRELIDLGFLEEEKEEVETEQRMEGSLQRKRTERPINQLPDLSKDTCVMEPWFARYLKLSKFIWAARTIIIRNRLLKVLEELKTVTPEKIEILEKRKRTVVNVSYAEIFENFL